jgi:hypothetical protein
MDDRQQARSRVPVEGSDQALVGHVLAPIRPHLLDLRSAAPRDLGDSLAEVPAHPDDHRVARLEQVREAGLHPGRPGGLNRHDQPRIRPVDPAKKRAQVEQDVVQLGVEMPEHWLSHRLERGGVEVGRAGTAEQPLGGGDRGGLLAHAAADSHSEPLPSN